MDITTIIALGAVFLCLISGGLGGAIRGGLWGERIKRYLRERPILGKQREAAWRAVLDRAIPIGVLCMAIPLALGGASWATVLAAPVLGWASAVNGHGLWVQMGRRGEDPPGRGNYTLRLLRALRITDDIVGKFWRDAAGMTVRGWEYGLAVGLLLWIDGGAWWVGFALGPLTAGAWALGYWLADLAKQDHGWRNGEILGGAVIALTACAGVAV